MQVTRVDRVLIGCHCGEPDRSSNEASGTHRNASTAARRKFCPHVPNLHKGLLLALLLLMTGLSAAMEYSFDENEIASTSDVSLPLPRPFDATACSFHHLAQQQHVLHALQQLQSSTTRGLLHDASMEALFKATHSGIVAEEV